MLFYLQPTDYYFYSVQMLMITASVNNQILFIEPLWCKSESCDFDCLKGVFV